tara:strand:- start:638 stop:940 length:303 start_codon:yes stop_codon:yes gene_type:complete
MVYGLYWTSTKSINGLKHFVVINKYKLNGEDYLELVSVLDDSICFKVSKKDFEQSGNWISGWLDNAKENILIEEYKAFKLGKNKDSYKIFLRKSSHFNIS